MKKLKKYFYISCLVAVDYLLIFPMVKTKQYLLFGTIIILFSVIIGRLIQVIDRGVK